MMKDNPTSLDRLHDIAIPPPVSWWPPAPGWYVLLAAAACIGGVLAYRCWRSWLANAYRRAALRELELANTAAAISEILKRSALAIAPRATIAELTGQEWCAWLTARAPDRMPQPVGEQLTAGIYRDLDPTVDIGALRDYASNWIRHHRPLEHADTYPRTTS